MVTGMLGFVWTLNYFKNDGLKHLFQQTALTLLLQFFIVKK